MKRNLLSYIENNYHNDIQIEVEKFLELYRFELFKINKWNHTYSIKSEIKYTAFKADINQDDSIDADIILSVMARVKFQNTLSAKIYNYIKILRLNCILRIEENKISFEYKFLDEGYSEVKEKPYNENLLLKIRKEDYQKYADNLLKAYNVVRNDDGSINPLLLLKKMNLKIVFCSITANQNINGMIVFKDKLFPVYNPESSKWEQRLIKANTIVLNSNLLAKKSLDASLNVTLCHEAIHFHYHRMALKLMMFFSRAASYLEYADNHKSTNNAIKWIEIQAYGVAPYLLVSNEAILSITKQKIEQTKYVDLYERKINLNYMAENIDYLVKRYDVTRLSIKRRLSELGFDDALGALNYSAFKQDYVDNYLVTKGELDNYTTYEIEQDMLIKMIDKDQRIKDFFKYQMFAYIDGHIVINDSKYIDRSINKLTYYAKTHMSECCIKFCYFYDEKTFEFIDVLFRDDSKRLTFYLSDKTDDIVEKAFKMDENKQRIDNIKQVEMAIYSLNFQDALLYIMNYQNLEPKELSIDSGLNQSTISRYMEGKNKCSNIKKCVALCCGLKLAPTLSEMIIKKCGLSFSDSTEDELLKVILYNMQEATPKERNEFMKSYGFKPITK